MNELNDTLYTILGTIPKERDIKGFDVRMSLTNMLNACDDAELLARCEVRPNKGAKAAKWYLLADEDSEHHFAVLKYDGVNDNHFMARVMQAIGDGVSCALSDIEFHGVWVGTSYFGDYKNLTFIVEGEEAVFSLTETVTY